MSSAELAGTRLCSQCQAIVKNVLPGNDIPATTVALSKQPAARSAASSTNTDGSRVEQTRVDSNQQHEGVANGEMSSPRAAADSLAENPPVEPVNSPFDFTTGPLVEEPPPATARLKGGVLETVLRESGALRSIETNQDQPSLAEELEKLRRTAGLEEPPANSTGSLKMPDGPVTDNPSVAAPKVDTTQLAEPQPAEPPVARTQPPLAQESRLRQPVPDQWNNADEWPVMLTDSPQPSSGKWKVLAAVALLLLVVGAVAVSYRVLVKPAKTGAEQEAKADLPRPQSSGASRSVTAAAATPDSRAAAQPQSPQPAAAASGQEPGTPQGDTSTAKYSLQAASMPNRAAAEEFAEKLVRAGVPAYVVSADIPGRGRWFRVRVGRFSSQEEAMRFAADAKLRARTAGIGLTLVPCDYEKPQM
jgi:hypothetical protein